MALISYGTFDLPGDWKSGQESNENRNKDRRTFALDSPLDLMGRASGVLDPAEGVACLLSLKIYERWLRKVRDNIATTR